MTFCLVCYFEKQFSKICWDFKRMTKKENSLHGTFLLFVSLDASKDGYIFCQSINKAGIIQHSLYFTQSCTQDELLRK